MINGGMYTPALYGNSAKYFTGSYLIVGPASKTAPANWLSGLGSSYDVGTGTPSNLPIRRLNYYSGANLDVATRSLTVASVFGGIKGHQRLVFPSNVDWSFNAHIT